MCRLSNIATLLHFLTESNENIENLVCWLPSLDKSKFVGHITGGVYTVEAIDLSLEANLWWFCRVLVATYNLELVNVVTMVGVLWPNNGCVPVAQFDIIIRHTPRYPAGMCTSCQTFLTFFELLKKLKVTRYYC
jgi:hypothetical protein